MTADNVDWKAVAEMARSRYELFSKLVWPLISEEDRLRIRAIMELDLAEREAGKE